MKHIISMPPVCGALELDDKSVCRQPFFVVTETEDSGIAVSELSPFDPERELSGYARMVLLPTPFLSGGIKLF